MNFNKTLNILLKNILINSIIIQAIIYVIAGELIERKSRSVFKMH